MGRYKKYLWIAASVLLGAALMLFAYPFFTATLAQTNTTRITGLNLAPALGHYVQVELKAANTQNVAFPRGTAELQWGPGPLQRERFQILTDNITRSYYLPLGENPYWQQDATISSLHLILPQMEGVTYEVENMRLKTRLLPALDSHINRYFKNIWQIDSIHRFLVPAYLLLAYTVAAALLYRAIFKSFKHNMTVLVSVIVLALFSAYFFLAQVYTARSYYIAYQEQIEQGALSETYQGFYDFRKFIAWVEESLPQEENLSVLLRGEPVYIMSEMAYNLYPRDIRFINISQRTNAEILNDISEASKHGYSHIVILSHQDRIESFRLNLVDSYREEAGYLYRFATE